VVKILSLLGVTHSHTKRRTCCQPSPIFTGHISPPPPPPPPPPSNKQKITVSQLVVIQHPDLYNKNSVRTRIRVRSCEKPFIPCVTSHDHAALVHHYGWVDRSISRARKAVKNVLRTCLGSLVCTHSIAGSSLFPQQDTVSLHCQTTTMYPQSVIRVIQTLSVYSWIWILLG